MIETYSNLLERRFIMNTNTKVQQLLLALIVTALVVSLASCKPAQPTDPIAIIQASNERINKGDLDGYLKYFADDAVISDEHGRSVGTQAIREYMQQEIVAKDFRFELSDLSADGDIVTYTCHVYMGNMDLGIVKGLSVIKDGKIIYDGSVDVYRYDCDKDPSQAFCPGN
jgi:hypothetical protein